MTTEASCDREHGSHERSRRSGDLHPAVDPRRVDPQGFLHRLDATLAHPHSDRSGIGGQAVYVIECQPGVIDRGQAGVHREVEGVAHEAPADIGCADAREHGRMFETLGPQGRSWCRSGRFAHPIDRIRLPGGLEERKPHIFMLFETNLYDLSDGHRFRVAADDVRGQVDPRVLLERHVCHHVRRIEIG